MIHVVFLSAMSIVAVFGIYCLADDIYEYIRKCREDLAKPV